MCGGFRTSECAAECAVVPSARCVRRRICPQMTTMAKGCRAISLIKGIEFNEQGPILISNMIKVLAIWLPSDCHLMPDNYL